MHCIAGNRFLSSIVCFTILQCINNDDLCVLWFCYCVIVAIVKLIRIPSTSSRHLP